MGHRALVAYKRPDGRYDLRYSHWGAHALALQERITAESPLGTGAVDPALFAASVSFEDILRDHLDPRTYEGLYLVAPTFAVDAHRVCWLGWDDGPVRGAIVPVITPARAERVETWFRATKTVLADVVDTGAISAETARYYLEARLVEELGGHPYTFDGADDTFGGTGESTA